MGRFLEVADIVFIWAFRLVENGYVGFVMGMVWVALVVTMIGELSMGLVYLFNRKHFARMQQEMVVHNNLSLRALTHKDKTSYKACNSVANDEFGKNFFAYIALFASSLWPVPFAMSWMEYRFGVVDFSVPLVGAVGPAFLFVPLYIVVRIVFSKVKHRLPLFGALAAKVKANDEQVDDLLTFGDLVDEANARQKASPSK